MTSQFVFQRLAFSWGHLYITTITLRKVRGLGDGICHIYYSNGPTRNNQGIAVHKLPYSYYPICKANALHG